MQTNGCGRPAEPGRRAGGVLAAGLLAGLALACGTARAECARADVQFYLDRGFTQQQIAQLCAPEPAASRRYRAYADEYVERRDAEDQARRHADWESALRTAIDATEVEVRRGHLHYTRRLCVREGLSGHRELMLQSCPRIRFRIRLAGLEVHDRERRKRVFFGASAIEVRGAVDRAELPGAFADIPNPVTRDILRAKLETGDTTRIPLRDGIEFLFAREMLLNFVKRETARAERREGADAAGRDELDAARR